MELKTVIYKMLETGRMITCTYEMVEGKQVPKIATFQSATNKCIPVSWDTAIEAVATPQIYKYELIGSFTITI